VEVLGVAGDDGVEPGLQAVKVLLEPEELVYKRQLVWLGVNLELEWKF